MKDIDKRHKFSKQIIVEAGDILLKYLNKNKSVRYKGRIDPVTKADKESENFICSNIRKNFPEDSIVLEENDSIKGKNDFIWFIDPIDGTVNFLHDFPYFCISIGLMYNNKIVSGTVYAPYLKELFYALKNKGSYLNNKKISVSKTLIPLKSLLCTGFPYSCNPKNKPNLKEFSYFTGQVQGIRRSGSAALDLCYTACGRFDGFWEPELKPYDVAAGSIIITEAGGICSDYSGKNNYIYGKEIIAGNKNIHRYILNSLQKIR